MELEVLFNRIFNVKDGTYIKIKITRKLKEEIKMLELLSEILKKLNIKELLDIYEKRGGNKKDLEKLLVGK